MRQFWQASTSIGSFPTLTTVFPRMVTLVNPSGVGYSGAREIPQHPSCAVPWSSSIRFPSMSS